MTIANIKTNSQVPISVSKALAFMINNFALLLKYILYIYYLMRFKKDQAKIQTLIDSSYEVNAMIPAYTAKLGLKIQSTNIRVQKIDYPTLKTFGIVLINFQIKNKLKRAWFF